jgi:hypothetical protein
MKKLLWLLSLSLVLGFATSACLEAEPSEASDPSTEVLLQPSAEGGTCAKGLAEKAALGARSFAEPRLASDPVPRCDDCHWPPVTTLGQPNLRSQSDPQLAVCEAAHGCILTAIRDGNPWLIDTCVAVLCGQQQQ